MRVMRILVLGGTRFVGRALVDQAVSRGHDVTTFTRGRHGEPRPGAEALHGDRTRPADLRPLAGRDWDAVIDTSVLALIGRRNDHFISAWVWHKKNIYAIHPTAPVSGTLDLENVPAGSWKVTWWDTSKGVPGESRVVAHPGGMLKLQTPPILRNAAVVLTRTQ